MRAMSDRGVRRCVCRQGRKRAGDAVRTTIQDVGVDLRRADVSMPEQFLNGTDVLALLEQMRGEGAPEGMAGFLIPAWRTACLIAF